MIEVTRLNGVKLSVNTELIATIEEHHDTVITLTDGKAYVVQETSEELVSLILLWKAKVISVADRLVIEVPVPASGLRLVTKAGE